MAIYRLRRLKAIQHSLASQQMFSTARSKSNLRSCIEVERKFTPTPKLLRYLDRAGDSLAVRKGPVQDRVAEALSGNTSLSSFHRLPDKSFRDTYYDINDELSKAGIWVRHRSAEILRTNKAIQFRSGRKSTTLEAKVRLGGNYANSQFHEIEGEVQIAAMLSKRLPRVKLEDLEVLTDLVTQRKSWMSLGNVHEYNSDGEMEIAVVLDKATATSVSAQMTEPLGHLIGEVEIMKQVFGGANEQEHATVRQKAAEMMDVCIKQFMLDRGHLFSTNPEPKGKLSAYFEWMQNQEFHL